MATAEELARVVEFRSRLVAYVNYVGENVRRYEDTPRHVQTRVADDQSWLSQEYGRIYCRDQALWARADGPVR